MKECNRIFLNRLSELLLYIYIILELSIKERRHEGEL